MVRLETFLQSTMCWCYENFSQVCLLLGTALQVSHVVHGSHLKQLHNMEASKWILNCLLHFWRNQTNVQIPQFFLFFRLMFYTLRSKTLGWSIHKAYLDGSNSSVLVNNIEELISPYGMTIDFPNQQLYWVDSAKDTIERINIDGKELKRNTITRVRDYKPPINARPLVSCLYSFIFFLKLSIENKTLPLIKVQSFSAGQHVYLKFYMSYNL